MSKSQKLWADLDAAVKKRDKAIAPLLKIYNEITIAPIMKEFEEDVRIANAEFLKSEN